MNSGAEDYSAALKLFRGRSIAQVRDYDMELSSKVVKSHERFTKELQVHYKDILKVTEEVNRLYADLKEGDALFMELCFKDELYKLDKLPDFYSGSDGKAGQPARTGGVGGETSQTLLVVSQWVLAISDLVSRFASSSSASKLFDSVMREFSELQALLDSADGYEKVIAAKCEIFLQFLCSPDTNLTLSQWIRTHNLVLQDGRQVFPWKKSTLEQFEGILFETVFREDLDSLLGSTDELVAHFVASEKFEGALKKKLLKDSQTLLERLDKLIESDGPDSPVLAFPETRPTAFNIPELVQESQFYSMGLATSRKVQWYKISTPLTGIIEKLEQHGGSSEAQRLREALIERLQQQKATAAPQDEEPASMDDVVSRMMSSYNDNKFTSMIDSKIRSLTVPSSEPRTEITSSS